MKARMIGLAVLLATLAAARGSAQQQALTVRLVTDEAEAVLAILDILAADLPIPPAEWQRLWQSEGYRRLKQRESSLGRTFEDSAFRAFVLSPPLRERRASLRAALAAWSAVDLEAAGRAAFAYLPEGAAIRTRVYPSIKPQPNTFVFETRTDPAIFFYLDPAITPAKFHNTLVHELHHIGIGSVCPTGADSATELETATAWMGGFAEGRAMLAAAGRPRVHPHATSEAAERAVWDRDVAMVEQDMRRLEEFFLAVADGELRGEQQNKVGMSFINTDTVPQGPFYTVGYVMASTVEAELGRARLVRSSCDPVTFLRDYNDAAVQHNRTADEHLPLWSEPLLRRFQPPASSRSTR